MAVFFYNAIKQFMGCKRVSPLLYTEFLINSFVFMHYAFQHAWVGVWAIPAFSLSPLSRLIGGMP